MTINKPSRLVPKLRFAEFIDEPHWECPPLEDLAKRVTKRNSEGAELRALTNSAQHGVIDQRKYFDKDIATNTDNYFVVERGDFVYNPRISSAAPVGPISKNKIGKGVISPLYSVFRFEDDTNNFFAHYFRSSHWHGYLRRVSNTGARHDRMAITNNDLMRMPIPVPSDRERHKVADCLDSLDALVSAQDKKLDALQKHKKGLLQQLFPQPSETVPRLRFPEFKDAPEWEAKTLGNEGEFLSSLTGKTGADFDCGDAHFIPYVNVFENTFIDTNDLRRVDVKEGESQNAVRRGDVFFTVSSETKQDAGMASVLLDDIDNCYLNSFCAMFRFHDDVDVTPVFIGYAMRSSPIREYLATNAQGSTRFNIGKTVFRRLVVCVPSRNEQVAIAKFLSAIDRRITAQMALVESLDRHRRGLLQRIFPSLEADSQ